MRCCICCAKARVFEAAAAAEAAGCLRLWRCPLLLRWLLLPLPLRLPLPKRCCSCCCCSWPRIGPGGERGMAGGGIAESETVAAMMSEAGELMENCG